MADQITVPTFEQIETILSRLATNYSNLAILFEDTFFNQEPMEVTFQMYNEEGVLETYTIPNLAMSLANMKQGEGSPEGRVTGVKGAIYQDLSNGDLYIKLLATGDEGWTKFITAAEMKNILVEGFGSPEGVVVANRGTLYTDRSGASLYIKGVNDGSEGWILISANVENLASRDLNNLTIIGEAHFAHPNLDNLSVAGREKFDAKEDVANKVSTLSASSTDTQYPTAKVTYDYVRNSINGLANIDFSNISTVAENKFVSINKLKDCILDAPTIMYRGADNSFILPIDTMLLCADGLTAHHTLNNRTITIAQNLAGVVPTLPNSEGRIFYDGTYNIVRTPLTSLYFNQETAPSVVNGGVWFNPAAYEYHVVVDVNEEATWVQVPMAEIGRWSTDGEGDVKTFEPFHPVELVNTESPEFDYSVIETGGDDTNWYRLSKDGWIEAGGNGYGNTEVAFHKNFKNTNYTFVVSGASSYTKATDGVTIIANGNFDWIAKGRVA